VPHVITLENGLRTYVVRLSEAEREALEAFIRTGRHPATQVLKARILLKADISEAGGGWCDRRIVTALEHQVVDRIADTPAPPARGRLRSRVCAANSPQTPLGGAFSTASPRPN
jgi:hypothetical protein